MREEASDDGVRLRGRVDGAVHDPARRMASARVRALGIRRATEALALARRAGAKLRVLSAATPRLSVQDPADFLIAASDRLDLLVCGSRGYGPQRAVLLGGVTRRVAAEARCPVIVPARGAETARKVSPARHPEPQRNPCPAPACGSHQGPYLLRSRG